MIKSAWAWAVEAFWPLLLLMAAAIAAPMTYAMKRDDAARRARTPERQATAAEWMKRNGVSGTATCFTWSNVCDVVPTDPRPPFKIECHHADDEDPAWCRVEP